MSRPASKEWREQAACASLILTRLFEPPLGETVSLNDAERYDIAADYCVDCPVIDYCRTDPSVQRSTGFRHGELWIHLPNRALIQIPHTPRTKILEGAA